MEYWMTLPSYELMMVRTYPGPLEPLLAYEPTVDPMYYERTDLRARRGKGPLTIVVPKDGDLE